MAPLLTRTVVFAATLLAAPAVATAQTPEADPSPESPSGHVYELPVDSARGDAAPKPRRGTPAPRSSNPAPSRGPAAAPAEGRPITPPQASPAPNAGRPTSAIRSENGFGTSTDVPGAARPEEGVRAAVDTPPAADASDPSGLRVYGLLLLGLAVAAGVALASRSARRTG